MSHVGRTKSLSLPGLEGWLLRSLWEPRSPAQSWGSISRTPSRSHNLPGGQTCYVGRQLCLSAMQHPTSISLPTESI